MHHLFDGMCRDTFIVSRIEFVVFVFVFVLYLGAGESKLKTASCPARGV